MWAKAAGEYYRKNKGTNGIESFSDVLKSPEFKQEYHAKYGKHGKTMGKKDRKGKGMRNTRKWRGGDGEVVPAKEEVANVEVANDVGGSVVAASKDVEGGAVAPATVPAVTGGKRKGSKKRRSAKKSSYKLW
jgi:hypothetical protein